MIFIPLTTTDGDIWLNAELIIDIHQDPAHKETCMVRYRSTSELNGTYECSNQPVDITQRIAALELLQLRQIK